MKIKNSKQKSAALRTAIDGILAALALVLSFLESLIPDIAFMPPGAKLGLSNIAVMFTVLAVGSVDGLVIALLKSGFVFLTRGASAFFMSVSGGMLSCLTLILLNFLRKKLHKNFSYIFISVICAVMHNIGQLCAACVYTKTNLLFAYLPALILFGIASGTITGIVLRTVMPQLIQLSRKLKQ